MKNRKRGDQPFDPAQENFVDVITIHLPVASETEKLLNKECLALLKPSAYFINTARGSVVDESAVIELLQARKIAGAGLVLCQHLADGLNPARVGAMLPVS